MIGDVKDHYFNYQRLISLSVVYLKTQLKAEFPIEGGTLVDLLQFAQRADAQGAQQLAQTYVREYSTFLQSVVHQAVTRRHFSGVGSHVAAFMEMPSPTSRHFEPLALTP